MIRTVSLRWMLALSLVVSASACGGSSSKTTPTTPSPQATVSSVAISGTASLTALGQTSQLTATASMSDGTTQNLSSSATWSSSDGSVIAVSSTGLATAMATGTATITATSQAKSGTLALSVSVASAATTYQGTLAGGSNQSGSFTVTIQTAISTSALGRSVRLLGAASASGTLTLINGGGAFTLTGTFDTSTRALSLSGGGFALTGAIGQGAITGTYTGPNNSSGGFAGLDSTNNSVTLLCGRYSSGNSNGIWNLQISASGAASGVTRPDVSSRDPQPRTSQLTGRLTGTTLTITAKDDGGLGTGTVQNGAVSGSYVASQPGDSGTFTGSTGACR